MDNKKAFLERANHNLNNPASIGEIATPKARAAEFRITPSAPKPAALII